LTVLGCSLRSAFVLLSVGVLALTGSAALAKAKPISTDQTAVLAIVENIYNDYNKPNTDETETESDSTTNSAEAEIQREKLLYSKSLRALLDRWNPIAHGDELYTMNSFDWYCQCQDFDPKTAKLINKSALNRGKDSIDVKTRFSAGWGDKKGSPMLIKFRREDGVWKIDELIMEDNMSLRAGLRDDIKEAAKAAKP
jgi:hypothetical protein